MSNWKQGARARARECPPGRSVSASQMEAHGRARSQTPHRSAHDQRDHFLGAVDVGRAVRVRKHEKAYRARHKYTATYECDDELPKCSALAASHHGSRHSRQLLEIGSRGAGGAAANGRAHPLQAGRRGHSSEHGSGGGGTSHEALQAPHQIRRDVAAYSAARFVTLAVRGRHAAHNSQPPESRQLSAYDCLRHRDRNGFLRSCRLNAHFSSRSRIICAETCDLAGARARPHAITLKRPHSQAHL